LIVHLAKIVDSRLLLNLAELSRLSFYYRDVRNIGVDNCILLETNLVAGQVAGALDWVPAGGAGFWGAPDGDIPPSRGACSGLRQGPGGNCVVTVDVADGQSLPPATPISLG
jgi:hypothetical protein